MLRGDDDSVDPHGLAAGVVFHRDLGFAVGTKVRAEAILSYFGKALAKLVGKRDRGGHQLGVLIDGEAEHHALVAGAAGVDSHGDVAGLLVDAGDHGAGVAVEAIERVIVADGLHDAADQRLEIHIGFGGDFSGDDDQAGCGESLAGDAAGGIFRQAGVEDGIGNLVSDFVWMSFGD